MKELRAADLEEKIRAALSVRVEKPLNSKGLTPAAVLVPLFRKEGSHHVLFTKRTDLVKSHKGEISFPGGVFDESDRTLKATALRESYEEIGVKATDLEILGCLDDVITVTNYLVRPFVGFLPYPYPFVISPKEIDEIIQIPLLALFERDRFDQKIIQSQGRERVIYTYRYGRHVIWGATAWILKQFLDLIDDW